MQQVLLNLLLNAVKFQTVGLITVDVQIVFGEIGSDAYTLEVAVLDQGTGMNDEQMRQIFTPRSQRS